MRIIGSIPHPVFKITVFKTDTRFAVKIENKDLEQTYKLRIAENMSSVADVKQLVNASFLSRVSVVFEKMGKNWQDAQVSIAPNKDDDNEFDVIV